MMQTTVEYYDDEDLVTIHAVRDFVLCPRRFALREIDGMGVGGYAAGPRVIPDESLSDASQPPGTRYARAVPLLSRRMGLTGRADAVAFPPGGASPVPMLLATFFTGEARGDDVQLCAQAACIEEMLGAHCSSGIIVSPAGAAYPPRIVEFMPGLRALVTGAVHGIRAQWNAPDRLPPTVFHPRCQQCPVRQECMPELAFSIEPATADIFLTKTATPTRTATSAAT